MRITQEAEAVREGFVNAHSARYIARLARARGITPEQAKQLLRDLYRGTVERSD